MHTLSIPNLGSGISSATVLSIFVKVGDTIEKNQTLLELETDKATAPIPASATGVIKEILIKEGEVVRTGMAFMLLEGELSVSTPASPAAPIVNTPVQDSPVEKNLALAASLPPVATSPTIKKLAHTIGLDLSLVKGTESGGRICIEDIKHHIHALQTQLHRPQASSEKPLTPPQESIDFSQWGPIEEKQVSSLRKKIAKKMSFSWTIPHVTQFDSIDITTLLALRKKYLPQYTQKGTKLTLTVFVLKAIVDSLKAFPTFNASYDEAKELLILKQYYHIGVAVDTDNGLIVPVIRDVDKKSIFDLCLELNELAQKARKRQLSIHDIQGGTFTLSNLGGLGAGPFTPIINAPESAILALSAGKEEPTVVDGRIEIRQKMPIGLSYDHRIIDGADGAKFMQHFIHTMTSFDPSQLDIN